MAVNFQKQTTDALTQETVKYLQTGEPVEAKFAKTIRDELAQKIAYIFCSLWHQGAFDIRLWRLDGDQKTQKLLVSFIESDIIVIKENVDPKELEALDAEDKMVLKGKSKETNSYVRYIFPNGKAYRYNYDAATKPLYVEDLKNLKLRYENLQIKQEVTPIKTEEKKGNKFFSKQCMITTAVALTSFVVGLIIFKK